MVLTAVPWAASHVPYDALDLATVLVFGVRLGLARRRSGSALTPFAMHALRNLVATVETAVVAG